MALVRDDNRVPLDGSNVAAALATVHVKAGESARSPLNALRQLRNKVAIDTGVADRL